MTGLALAGCTSAKADAIFASVDDSQAGALRTVARFVVDDDPASTGIDSIAWNPASSTIAALLNTGKTIRAFHVPDGTKAAAFDIASAGISLDAPLFFLSNTMVLAAMPGGTAAGDDRTALGAWNLKSGKTVAAVFGDGSAEHKAGLIAPILIALSSDRTKGAAAVVADPHLYGGGAPQEVELALFTLKTGARPIFVPWKGFARGYPTSLAFGPDGTSLAVGTSAGEVVLLDAATGHVAAMIAAGSAPCSGIAFSKDGALLAIGYAPWNATPPVAQVIEIWDLAQHSRRHALAVPVLAYGGHPAQPRTHALIWDWDRDRIAVGTDDAVVVWANASAVPQPIFSRTMPKNASGHAAFRPYDLAFSTDGALAVATDKTVEILR